MKKTVYIILSFLVFVYLTLRAIYVPLVHDEIATFFYYIQQIDFNPLAGANPDANNHILNSILGGVSHKYLGYSAFSIRLPNLLSFILYAFYVYKIGQFLTKKWTQIAFYLSLLFAVYFVQFFALSRGYGLSMAFLFGAFYYCMTLYQSSSSRNLALGLVFSVLAVLANMSLLPLVLLLAIVMKVMVLINFKSYNTLKSYLWTVPSILIWLAGMYVAVKISFKMKDEGSLYYGELDGFWDVTVKSQLLMLFENDSFIPQFLTFLVILIVLWVCIKLIFSQKLNSVFNRNLFFFFLLVGSIVGIELMAIILKVNYPEDRVGMYLIPLFIGALCFGVEDLKSKNAKYFLIPLLVFPVHFLSTLNLEKSSLWQVEFIPERFYSEIKNNSTDSVYPSSVGGDGQRIFNYTQKLYSDTVSPKSNMMQLWQKTLFDSNLDINLPNHPAQFFDYLVTKPEYVKDLLPLYDSIDYAEFAKFRLYKRKKSAQKEKLREFTTKQKSESSAEFIEFYHETFDSCQYDALMLGIKLRLQSLSHPFRARVVAELKYKDGDQIDYQFFQLNWMYDRMEKDNEIVQSMIFNNLQHYIKNGPLELKVYLWNIKKKPYTLYEAEVDEFRVFD